MDELRTDDLTVFRDPFALFRAWQDLACETEVNDPTAMAVATVDERGLPDVRMVLLKGWDERGFVFYTNFESAKGGEILAHPKVAALFHWKSQRKQVRIRGPVEVVDDAEADAYFASRARESRLGAWASAQSRPLASRSVLEAMVEATAERFPDAVPRPPHWSGFRIRPLQIEFWADGAFRLHDRILFARSDVDDGWSPTRLYP